MANLIPNENVWVGWVESTLTHPDGVISINAPTAAETLAAIDLTDHLITLTASSSGNTVPTPRLRTLFETNIPGTAAAQFSADFYRDDENDLAWSTLKRGDRGVFIISRFGGTGTNKRPIAGDKVEVWPVRIAQVSNNAVASNTAETITVTGAVHKEPNENATVAA